jgi:polysaccharide biosynthesis transport protein
VIEWQPKSAGRHELDVKQWLDVARRRWLTIAAAAIVAVAIAALSIVMTPPRFVAESALALNARKIQVLQPLETVVSQLPQENPTLRTELDVIASRSMGEKVLDRLDSTAPPTSTASEAREPSWFEAMIDVAKSHIIDVPKSYWYNLFPPEPVAPVAPEILRAQRVGQLLGGLKLTNDGHSYTIFLDYTATDPNFAARAANAFAEVYISHQVDMQEEATVRANEWLRGKLEDLRAKLSASETAAEDFRRTSHLFESNGTLLQSQRMAALSNEIAIARAARAGAEARLTTATELSRSPDGLETISETLNDPTIQNLRKDEAQAARSVVEIEQAGALKNSELPLLKSQLDSIRTKIGEEVQRHLESLKNEVIIAQRKEQELDATLSRMEDVFAEASRAMVQLKQLEREANSNKAVYETYLNRYNQTLEQQGFALPESTLITRAEAPSRPTNPKTSILLLGLLGGLGAGFALAMVRDSLDNRIRSGRLLEQKTGASILGRIPELSRRGRVPPQDHPVRMPHTPYSHAVRKLNTTLSLSPLMMSGPKVIVVTSAVPDEGKSTLCVSLARSMAGTGLRVVVVDCDLRNPSVALTFGVPDGIGLCDLVNGLAVYEDADQIDRLSKAHFISIGHQSPSDDSHLIGSDSFKSLVAMLRLQYDVVIVDAPPVLASADTALLGTMADATLFVARWGHTSYDAVVSSLRQLSLCGTPVAGLILHRIEDDVFLNYETGNQPHPKYSGNYYAASKGTRSDGRKTEPRDGKTRVGTASATSSRRETEKS